MVVDNQLQENIRNILENDGVIAFVTDTVWGLGCLPDKKRAVEKIYTIKHREKEKPLILMSDDVYPLLKYIKPLSKEAHKLIKQYFPGALTIVVEKSNETPDYITAGMHTVGIRVPCNDVFAEICRCTTSRVLATTSANLSHEPAALNYDEAMRYIGDKVDLVIRDYGYSAKGKASTVVGCFNNEIQIFRQGDIFIE